jgi:hypothetical protein
MVSRCFLLFELEVVLFAVVVEQEVVVVVVVVDKGVEVVAKPAAVVTVASVAEKIHYPNRMIAVSLVLLS